MIFLILLFVIGALWLYLDTKPPSKYPPGPDWWPVVGNALQISKKRKSLGFYHLVWDDLANQYGPVVGLKLGSKKFVLVSGQLIKEVYTRPEFDGRPNDFIWKVRCGEECAGIVFADGPKWQELRNFSVQHLRKLGYGRSCMEDIILEEASSLVEWFKSRQGSPVPMDQFFDISVLNVLWAFIAGKRFDRDDPYFRRVCDAIHESFRTLDMSGGLLSHLPILRYVAPTWCGFKAVQDNLKEMNSFLHDTIEEHKKSTRNGEANDFIDAFLDEMNKNEDKDSIFTEKQLYVSCLDFLQAGSDTTSNSLSFLILHLIRNPEVQKKVQEEIDQVIGRKINPQLSHRAKMPYTGAVLNELQRISSVAPVGIAHRTLQDTHLAGYQIPEGTTVLLLLRNLHLTQQWKDPDEFRPERFLQKNDETQQNEMFFIPFGLGRRKCLGEVLAKANLFLYLTFLLQSFHISSPACEPKPALDMYDGVTISPKPFNACFISRT